MNATLRLLAVLALLAPSPASAVVLKLRAGGDQDAASVTFDGKSVRLPDGKTLPRDEVEEIRFAQAAPEKAPAAASADPAAAARGRELFARAKALEARFPGADGLLLLDDGDYELRPDGTWTFHYHFVGKVLKEGMKFSWGNVSEDFEDGRSRVKILKATVYEPDGRVFPLDPSKIQVSRPQADSLFFQDSRTMTYPLPQVEVGSIVEYETESETYNPFRKDFFFPRWGFLSGTPVRVSRVRIGVPAGTALYYSARHFSGPWKGKGRPVVTTADGRTTYRWELRDLAPIVGEPRMVQYEDYSPFVKAALFDKWDRIYDWLGEMYRKRTNPSPELAEFTRQLVKGCGTDDERVAAIYRYVQKRVRYIAVKMGVASGWGGYDANLTWKRGFGCCIDKALLLTTMLKVIGIRSTPVLLDPNMEADHDFSVPDIGFAHAITRLTLDGKEMFLDSVGEDYRFPEIPSMDYGVKVLDVFDRSVVPVPVPPPSGNISRYEYDLTLSTDGSAGLRYAATYDGTREGDLRAYYKTLKDSDLKRQFQDWVNGISPAGILTDYRVGDATDLTKPFGMGFDCRLPDYLIRAGDLDILKLPGLEQSFPEVALDKRRYAMEYAVSFEKSYRYRIALPPGFQAVSIPKPARLNGPGESFTLSCRASASDLTCDADLRRADRVYAPSQYAAHKAFLDKVARLTKDRIFLKGGGA